jgi:hypothetical protein
MRVVCRCRPVVLVAALLMAALAVTVLWVGGRPPDQTVTHPARSNAVSDLLADSSSGWTSGNWSGYAVTAGGYTQVSASWTVPTPAATPTPTYSGIWIGIDGFDNNSLIQIGTEHDATASGAQYYAWWEVLPSPEARASSLAVHGGDRVSASISRAASGSWTLAMTNQTTGRSFATTQSYGGPLASAEWIVEAPNVGNQPTSLAHYGQVPFSQVDANGASPNLTRAEGGVMVQNGQQVSTPSNPGLSGASFNMAYGAMQPASPMF